MQLFHLSNTPVSSLTLYYPQFWLVSASRIPSRVALAEEKTRLMAGHFDWFLNRTSLEIVDKFQASEFSAELRPLRRELRGHAA